MFKKKKIHVYMYMQQKERNNVRNETFTNTFPVTQTINTCTFHWNSYTQTSTQILGNHIYTWCKNQWMSSKESERLSVGVIMSANMYIYVCAWVYVCMKVCLLAFIHFIFIHIAYFRVIVWNFINMYSYRVCLTRNLCWLNGNWMKF